MKRRAERYALSNVPATILFLFESISFANCLASVSVGKVLVCLANVCSPRRCFGISTETNQRFFTECLAINLSLFLIRQPRNSAQFPCCLCPLRGGFEAQVFKNLL